MPDKRSRHHALLIACFLAGLLTSAGARSENDGEMATELLHSNLPLYTFKWEQLWPRGFSDDDGFGCTSRIAFGDWHFTPASGNEFEDESWERYENYGVFHCAAIIRTADVQKDLDDAKADYGFFVRLGLARLGQEEWEIWAIQVGTLPGSQYRLIARKAENEGLIKEFQVLQQTCPPGTHMEAKGLDIWRTRYCLIDSRETLLKLGHEMLRRPHRGQLQFKKRAGD